MGKNNNIIEINGHRYDAISGAKLTTAAPHPQKQTRPATARQPAPVPKPAHRNARRPVKHASHAPAPPRTLMRQGLKKPRPSLKRSHKVHAPAGVSLPQSLSDMVLAPPAHQLDEKRLRHAQRIRRSNLISHFPPAAAGPEASSHITVKVRTSHAADIHAAQARRPAAAVHPHKPQTTTDMLDRAVKQATSHLQPPPPKHRRGERLKRNLGAGAAIGLSVLILGVIVVQNSSNVRLQMASAKAGFNVSLPNYRPAGFGLDQLNYSDGVAAAEFRDQDSHYTVTQKRTSWDDLDLRDKFVAAGYEQYQTVLNGNLVIYIYGNHNATWVDGGVWYIVQTDGSLSNRQLVDMATSF